MSSSVETGILFLIVLFNIVSSLPFDNKAATETDNEFGGHQDKRKNEEANLESSFGGPAYVRSRRHIEFDKLLGTLQQFKDMLHARDNFGPNTNFPLGNPHDFHRGNLNHNHGVPVGYHPPRGEVYGHEDPLFGHFPENHRRFGDPNFNWCHPQPWDHPPHYPHKENGGKPPNRRTDVIPDTNNATDPDIKNQDDVTDIIIIENGQATAKTTQYPPIDIRFGTRK
ncbi:uncharacterized protein LOC130903826 [Diorhabda carinulata]|uniref:uncharacterized protein LOC130903826 n=1 Tax=Diorhabda carinulata TaxID=1163345 RepID=UPI0025A26D87|nr:uncharacterized protein LOC130903826 [Diorhabda carinulata]